MTDLQESDARSQAIPRALIERRNDGFRWTAWTRYGEVQGWDMTFAAAALQAAHVIQMHERPTP